jgi:rubrerythrin
MWIEAATLRRILREVVLRGLPLAALGCGEDVSTLPPTPTFYCGGSFPLSTEEARRLGEGTRALVTADCELFCLNEEERGRYRNPSAPGCSLVSQPLRWEITCASSTCAEGRRPAGLAARTLEATTPGAWLAHAAWLEGASVQAFETLRAELESLDAPASLVQAAREAAEDERRHARTTTALARRYGASAETAVVAPARRRPVADIALENAIEGCVRETYGAAVALIQAESAEEPAVRRAYAAVAEDEARHAALAWAVDAWLTPQLTAAGLDRVRAAGAAAVAELAASATLEAGAETRRLLGLPDAASQHRLVHALADRLWT